MKKTKLIPKNKKKTTPVLSAALERERQVSIPEAAYLKGISEDTFRRHYAHLINHPSVRRCTVKLGDILET